MSEQKPILGYDTVIETSNGQPGGKIVRTLIDGVPVYPTSITVEHTPDGPVTTIVFRLEDYAPMYRKAAPKEGK